MTMRWSGSSAGDVRAALEEFIRRIGVFDPPPTRAPVQYPEPGVAYSPAHAAGHEPGFARDDSADFGRGGGAGAANGSGDGPSGDRGGGSGGGSGRVELRVDGEVAVWLSPGVARALVEALGAYHDPRDRGTCDHCGGPRLDDNFVCADCGQPSGLFGQLLRERAARYEGPAGEINGEPGA
jgi:hypothetical protein